MKVGFDQMVHGALDMSMIQSHEYFNSPINSSSTTTVGLIPLNNPTINHNHPINNNNNNINIQFSKAAAPVIENRCLNLDRNELSEWVEHITKQLIEDDGYSPETATVDANFPSSDHDNFVNNQSTSLSGSADYFRPRKIPRRTYYLNSENDVVNDHDVIQWNNNNNNNDQLQVIKQAAYNHDYDDRIKNNNNYDHDQEQEQGLTLMTMMSLLLECAVAISVDNLGEAHRMLLELTQTASPYAESCAERVVAYFAKAMSGRVINSWLGICSPYPRVISQDHHHRSLPAAFHVLNNVTPFVKFAHFTSNQAILEAFHRRDRLHIIDLDVMHGLQWPALFHILATRAEGPPSHVRITALGASAEILSETGRQLSLFAKRLGLFSFEFCPLLLPDLHHDRNVDVSRFRLRRDETLAVHWLRHCLYDASAGGPDWRTMKLVEQLSPRVFTLVEQDVNAYCSQNGGSFLDRFVGSLHYYSTVFDSVGSYLGCDNPNRYKVEHGLFYREINNILAIGGPARSGEEKFRRSWRSELAARARQGYCWAQVAMSANAMAQAQLILNMFPAAHGYTLLQGDGTLRLGWKQTSLYTASAWTCTNTTTTTSTSTSNIINS